MTDQEQAGIKLEAIESAQAAKSRLACLQFKLSRMSDQLSSAGSAIIHVNSELKQGGRTYHDLRTYPSYTDVTKVVEEIKTATEQLHQIKQTLKDLGLGNILSD